MVDARDLHEVLCHRPRLDVVVVGLGDPPEEVDRVGVAEVELEGLQEVPLRSEDLVVSVPSVGHVEEVLNRGTDDFFVLGSDEEGGGSDELELDEGDGSSREEPVDEVDGEEEGFGEETELSVDLDEPVDEDPTHLPLEFGLVGHVVPVWHGVDLEERERGRERGGKEGRRGEKRRRRRRSVFVVLNSQNFVAPSLLHGEEGRSTKDEEEERKRKRTSSFCM